jgi:hypothetical protein
MNLTNGVSRSMRSPAPSRVSAILMIGVFFINVYIGLFDTTLQQYNVAHLYLNWLMAAVDVIAAGLLFARPLERFLVVLGGIVWPIIYIASIAVDVETRLCLGGGNCLLPNTAAAYDYLILGYSDLGWVLWPYTIITAISLLSGIIVISVAALIEERSSSSAKTGPTEHTDAEKTGTDNKRSS